jgi:hypothetical protein
LSIIVVLEGRAVCKRLASSKKEKKKLDNNVNPCGDETTTTSYPGWEILTKSHFKFKILCLLSISSISISSLYLVGALASKLVGVRNFLSKENSTLFQTVPAQFMFEGVVATSVLHTAYMPRVFQNSNIKAVKKILPFPHQMTRISVPNFNKQEETVINSSLKALGTAILSFVERHPLVSILRLETNAQMEIAFQNLRTSPHGKFYTTYFPDYYSLKTTSFSILELINYLNPPPRATEKRRVPLTVPVNAGADFSITTPSTSIEYSSSSSSAALVSSSLPSSSSSSSSAALVSSSLPSSSLVAATSTSIELSSSSLPSEEKFSKPSEKAQECICGLEGHQTVKSKSCIIHKENGLYQHHLYKSHYAKRKTFSKLFIFL